MVQYKRVCLAGQINLISQMAGDFLEYSIENTKTPQSLKYTFLDSLEPNKVERSARKAALLSLQPVLTKFAFDTRRVDQDNERVPRSNLQYWHRSQEFLDEEDRNKIDTFTKLNQVLHNIHNDFGGSPEWQDSYSRVLADTVDRVLRVKQADGDIFRPQLSYLEQLLLARYRVTLEQINKLAHDEIMNIILSKDEKLAKLGMIPVVVKTTKDSDKGLSKSGDSSEIAAINSTLRSLNSSLQNMAKQVNGVQNTSVPSGGGGSQIVIDCNKNGSHSSESGLNAIFGNVARKDGEKVVERTITITIRDEVKE